VEFEQVCVQRESNVVGSLAPEGKHNARRLFKLVDGRHDFQRNFLKVQSVALVIIGGDTGNEMSDKNQESTIKKKGKFLKSFSHFKSLSKEKKISNNGRLRVAVDHDGFLAHSLQLLHAANRAGVKLDGGADPVDAGAQHNHAVVEGGALNRLKNSNICRKNSFFHLHSR
jgi:hypothetical protein